MQIESLKKKSIKPKQEQTETKMHTIASLLGGVNIIYVESSMRSSVRYFSQ